MAIRRLRSPLAAGVIASGLLGLAIAVVAVSSSEPPAMITDLERAQAAAERARSNSSDLVGDLHRIASNLEAGFEIGDRTARIHALTEKQAQSLRSLGELLEQQIARLRTTVARLDETSATAASIEDLSDAQARTLRMSISALRRLESYARASSAVSADLSRYARYGARLAEDSRREFSTP